MNIPNRIIGNINYNDVEIPYEYDQDKKILKFFRKIENDNKEELCKGVYIYSHDPKKHEWVERIQFKGKTSEGYNIIFGTKKNPSIYNGYRKYSVDWFYMYNNQDEDINEIRISGKEINYFFPPARVFTPELFENEDKPTIIDKFKVEAAKAEEYILGEYEQNGRTTSIKCAAFPSLHFNSEKPLSGNAYMYISFSRKIEINELYEKILILSSFIKYITYRENYFFSEIETFSFDEDGKKRNCGRFILNIDHKEEKNKKVKNRIISADLLGEKTAQLFKKIEKGEIPIGHICKSIDDVRHYSNSRMIMILATFESEFRDIYGQDVQRSKLYKDTKQEIINVIDEYSKQNGCKGKKKKYIKTISNSISNLDSSYGDNLEYALQDCRRIMEPFVCNKFDGEYDNIIGEVSININDLRNGIAHSKLDMKLEARQLAEIHIVEELIYAVRLKKLGVDETNIKKAIDKLFDEGVLI